MRRTDASVDQMSVAEATPAAGRNHTLPEQQNRTFLSSFVALKHRNYRLLWIGNLISNTGDWMDTVAFNWLVYSLTDSAIWLAIVNMARWIPIMVFTLIGGVVADRIERRHMMFLTQAAAMAMAILLAVLVATGLAQMWMVLAIAFGRGIMNSFNQPAKQSLISELVPPEDLRNAISLNAAQFNLTRVIGPAVGGILIAAVGVVGAFYLNGLSFLAVLWSLAEMRFANRPPARAHGDLFSELKEGIVYMRRRPTLGMLVVLALIPLLLGMPYQTMLTVFASDVLRVGSVGLGLLTACSSVGAVVGALAVGWMANSGNRGWQMLLSLVAYGAALLLFGISGSLPVSVAALFAVGLFQQVYLTINNSIVQETVDEEYRGRIISLLFLNRGMMPLGTMFAGLGAAWIGVQPTTALMAILLILLTVGALRIAPQLRELA